MVDTPTIGLHLLTNTDKRPVVAATGVDELCFVGVKCPSCYRFMGRT